MTTSSYLRHALALLLLLATPLFGQQTDFVYSDFAQDVLAKAKAGGAVSEREALLLMTQPEQFNKLMAEWKDAKADKAVERVLGIRREIFLRALKRLESKVGVKAAVLAMGSWAVALNTGDMDAIALGGRDDALRLNELLADEIDRVFYGPGDDLATRTLRPGQTFTLETFEIYVSTFEEFGRERISRVWIQAFDLFHNGDPVGARRLLNDAMLAELKAQNWAAAHSEYYAGRAGQQWAKLYLSSAGKGHLWQFDPATGRLADRGGKALTEVSDDLIRALDLLPDAGGKSANFTILATEYSEWIQRASRGPREQAKGLARGFRACLDPRAIWKSLSAEQGRTLICSILLSNLDRSELTTIQKVLESFGLAANFDEMGRGILHRILLESNRAAISELGAAQTAALKALSDEAARKGGPSFFRELAQARMADLLAVEHLAGLRKLPPDTVRELAGTIPDDFPYQQEMKDLYELIAQGVTKDREDAGALVRQLLKIARRNNRVAESVAREAEEALVKGGHLSAQVESELALIRRELADLAAVQKNMPQASLEECLEFLSKNGRKHLLQLDDETRLLIKKIASLSEVELLSIGFKDGDLAVLRRVLEAEAKGNPAKWVQWMKTRFPTRWQAVVGGAMLTGMTAVGGGLLYYQLAELAANTSLSDAEFELRYMEAVVTAVPVVGMILEGWDAVNYGTGDEKQFAQALGFTCIEVLSVTAESGGPLSLAVLVAYGLKQISDFERLQNDEREFIHALYLALNKETLNGLTLFDGTEASFDTEGIQLVPDLAQQRIDIVHSPAFDRLYRNGDGVLLKGEFNRPVGKALRAYAKKYAWDTHPELAQWRAAAEQCFPGLDVEALESDRVGDLAQFREQHSKQSFKAGYHVVRRYLFTRDLLTESMLRQLKNRVAGMTVPTQELEAEVRKLEPELGLRNKIVPNAKGEVSSFWESLKNFLLTPQTRIEQVKNIWLRYIATYKELITEYQRVSEKLKAAGFAIHPANEMIGLIGEEKADRIALDAFSVRYGEIHKMALDSFTEAKGGKPDNSLPFDHDAWVELLGCWLEKERIANEVHTNNPDSANKLDLVVDATMPLLDRIEAVLQRIRDHYHSKEALTLETPNEMKVGEKAVLKATYTARGKTERPDIKFHWTSQPELTFPSSELVPFEPTKEGAYTITVAVLENKAAGIELAKTNATIQVVKEEAGKTIQLSITGAKEGVLNTAVPLTAVLTADEKIKPQLTVQWEVRKGAGVILDLETGLQVQASSKLPVSAEVTAVAWRKADGAESAVATAMHSIKFLPASQEDKPGESDPRTDNHTVQWTIIPESPTTNSVVILKHTSFATVNNPAEDTSEWDIKSDLDDAPIRISVRPLALISNGALFACGKTGNYVVTHSYKDNKSGVYITITSPSFRVSSDIIPIEVPPDIFVVVPFKAKIAVPDELILIANTVEWHYVSYVFNGPEAAPSVWECGSTYMLGPLSKEAIIQVMFSSGTSDVVDIQNDYNHIEVTGRMGADVLFHARSATIRAAAPPFIPSPYLSKYGNPRAVITKKSTSRDYYGPAPYEMEIVHSIGVGVSEIDWYKSEAGLGGDVPDDESTPPEGSRPKQLGPFRGYQWSREGTGYPYGPRRIGYDREVSCQFGGARLRVKSSLDSGFNFGFDEEVNRFRVEESTRIRREIDAFMDGYTVPFSGESANPFSEITPGAPPGGMNHFTVSLKPNPIPKVGDGSVLDVEAMASGMAPDEGELTYAWEGVKSSQGAKAVLNTDKAGKFKVAVVVSGKSGQLGRHEEPYEVGETVKIVVEPASATGKEFPAGGTLPLKVRWEKGESQASKVTAYRWHSNNDVKFNPEEGAKPETVATLPRTGRTLIHVVALATEDGTQKTVAESDNYELEVVEPKLEITASKSSPFVGEPVLITTTLTPKSDDAFYLWDLPRNVYKLGKLQKDTQVNVFCKDTNPAIIKVTARSAKGDDLGITNCTLQAHLYSVRTTVTGPAFKGVRVRVYDPAKKEFVLPPQDVFGTGQQVLLKAALDGQPPPTEVHWAWSVDSSDGTTLVSGESNPEVCLSRSEAGTARAKVMVYGPEKVFLGQGEGSFTVMESEVQTRKIKVKLAADKQTPKIGEKVRFTATVQDALDPVTYAWTPAELNTNKASVLLEVRSSGKQEVTVTATDSRRISGTTNIILMVQPEAGTTRSAERSAPAVQTVARGDIAVAQEARPLASTPPESTQRPESQPAASAGSASSLTLATRTARPGEYIKVTIQNPPTGKNAWIGFYEVGADHKSYEKYSYLNRLDRNLYEDASAGNPGQYEFRLFKDEEYVPVAVSDPVTVK